MRPTTRAYRLAMLRVDFCREAMEYRRLQLAGDVGGMVAHALHTPSKVLRILEAW